MQGEIKLINMECICFLSVIATLVRFNCFKKSCLYLNYIFPQSAQLLALVYLKFNIYLLAVLAFLFTLNITITSVVFANIAAAFVPCFTAAYDMMNNMIKKFNDKEALEKYQGTKKDTERTTLL